nr:MAG TPA: hypothetical protein [Caudoviricetes sp.]
MSIIQILIYTQIYHYILIINVITLIIMKQITS